MSNFSCGHFEITTDRTDHGWVWSAYDGRDGILLSSPATIRYLSEQDAINAANHAIDNEYNAADNVVFVATVKDGDGHREIARGDWKSIAPAVGALCAGIHGAGWEFAKSESFGKLGRCFSHTLTKAGSSDRIVRLDVATPTPADSRASGYDLGASAFGPTSDAYPREFMEGWQAGYKAARSAAQSAAT